MKWFMPLLLTGLLAVVGYGMWTAMNKKPGHEHGFFGQSGGPAPTLQPDLQPPMIETNPPEPAGAPTMVTPQPPPFENPPLPDNDPATAESAGLPFESGDRGAVALVTDHQDVELPGSVESEFQAALRQAEAMLARNELEQAHLALSSWYADREKLSPESAQKLLDLLDQLAGAVVYSRNYHLARPHVVKEHETAEQIAAQYQVPWPLLAKINGISDPASLRPGETLKVVPGPFHGEIDLSDFELTLLLEGGRYAGRFPIGVGSEVEPVEGQYQVTVKRVDPAYNNALAGDPRNPLGRRLIVLQKEAPAVQLAIHGTNDPASVGKPCQEGCIRLRPIDVENVYDILSANKSQVRIRR